MVAGAGRWAGRFCRSFCQCQDNSCKIMGFDLLNRKKTKHFSSSTVNQLHTECQLLDWVAQRPAEPLLQSSSIFLMI